MNTIPLRNRLDREKKKSGLNMTRGNSHPL
jgi:hypothetical protein